MVLILVVNTFSKGTTIQTQEEAPEVSHMEEQPKGEPQGEIPEEGVEEQKVIVEEKVGEEG